MYKVFRFMGIFFCFISLSVLLSPPRNFNYRLIPSLKETYQSIISQSFHVRGGFGCFIFFPRNSFRLQIPKNKRNIPDRLCIIPVDHSTSSGKRFYAFFFRYFCYFISRMDFLQTFLLISLLTFIYFFGFYLCFFFIATLVSSFSPTSKY